MPPPVIHDENSAGPGAGDLPGTALGLNAIRRDLKSLCIPANGEEAGTVPPSPYALGRVNEILEQTSLAMQSQPPFDPLMEFPRGYVTTDDAGGVRIEWWRENTHCVHLVVGGAPDEPEYVFVRLGEQDPAVIDRPLIPARLAAHLRSLSLAAATNG